MKEASIHDLMHPRWRDEEIERLRLTNEQLQSLVGLQQREIEQMLAVLEMIAGVRQCPDNMLGNADIARIELRRISGDQQTAEPKS